MKTKLAFAALAALCFAFPASATDPIVSSLTARASVQPLSYTGRCPGSITIYGQILVDGIIQPDHPYRVGYYARNSQDGTTTPQNVAVFTAPGAQIERISVATSPDPTGSARWEFFVFQLDGPDALAPNHRFNAPVAIPMACQGNFTGVMTQFQAPPPPHVNAADLRQVHASATLHTFVPNYLGPCPTSVRFNGEIVVTGVLARGLQIGYSFEVNDGGMRVQRSGGVINVTGPGSYLVADTLENVGTPGRVVTGWEQIVAGPTVGGTIGGQSQITSARADFSVTCR